MRKVLLFILIFFITISSALASVSLVYPTDGEKIVTSTQNLLHKFNTTLDYFDNCSLLGNVSGTYDTISSMTYNDNVFINNTENINTHSCVGDYSNCENAIDGDWSTLTAVTTNGAANISEFIPIPKNQYDRIKANWTYKIESNSHQTRVYAKNVTDGNWIEISTNIVPFAAVLEEVEIPSDAIQGDFISIQTRIASCGGVCGKPEYYEGNITYHMENFTFDPVNYSIGNYTWTSSCSLGGTNYTTSNYSFSFALALDECIENDFIILNMSMFEDTINDYITSPLDIYFEVERDDIDGVITKNFSFNNGNNYTICKPETINYTIFSQMEYGDFGDYNAKTYYLVDTMLAQTRQDITLWLTPNATPVTFTVTDENDNKVNDLYIHVLKYDFGSNTHTTNEIIKTDADGEAIGQIVPTTQWYKFMLIKDGVVLLETDPVKISSASRSFRVNFQQDYYDFYDIRNNITTSLTYTNETKNIAYTFVNPTGAAVTACLTVYRKQFDADILVNESCTSSASGTILINLGETSNKVFHAVGTTQVNPDFVTDVIDVSFEEGYKVYGKDAIFITFFIRLAFAMIGLWNIIVGIFLIIIVDLLMVFAGLYALDWTTAIIYLIMGLITIWRLNR